MTNKKSENSLIDGVSSILGDHDDSELGHDKIRLDTMSKEQHDIVTKILDSFETVLNTPNPDRKVSLSTRVDRWKEEDELHKEILVAKLTIDLHSDEHVDTDSPCVQIYVHLKINDNQAAELSTIVDISESPSGNNLRTSAYFHFHEFPRDVSEHIIKISNDINENQIKQFQETTARAFEIIETLKIDGMILGNT